MDIIVIFNTAFLSQNFELEEDRKKIAINYLKGWFTIDFIAVIPF